MIYLKNFNFPSDDAESNFIWGINETCFDSYYPFRTLAAKGVLRLDFEPLTILYGGNGLGKTTALNVIAEKISARRGAKIYDFDDNATIKKWTELENVRLLREFFEARRER
ncbi:MAG: hypothetical protein FWC70_07905 [Defluviitaleaceae bacterium]|nr:hypothetical protein [Defluviitaleaceae bacterium]